MTNADPVRYWEREIDRLLAERKARRLWPIEDETLKALIWQRAGALIERGRTADDHQRPC